MIGSLLMIRYARLIVLAKVAVLLQNVLVDARLVEAARVDLEADDRANNDEKDAPSINVRESLEPTDSKIIKGKNLNKECRTQQLKEKLKDTNYTTPDNIESILAGAHGRSKKPLPNEEEFYNTIISNNLISLIRNPHKFKKYIRPSFYKV